MVWIKVDQALLDHEKTWRLADELELSPLYTVSHLVALWMWAIDHADDGKLPASDALIAHAARWPEDSEIDAADFVQALVNAGFVDDNFADGESRQRTIHSWAEWSGTLMQKRKANAKRMRKARSKK